MQQPDGTWTQDPTCWPLKASEVLAEADYEFRLGKPSGARETHPPGTHWYHPHSHGATFPQVASGMADLLIVEGEVDDALKEQLDPTGEGVTYRERPIVIQRIVGPKPIDIEAGFTREGQPRPKSSTAFPAVNGHTGENYIVVAPGAIERWRVLNASVDGQGYFEFSVVEGEDKDGALYEDIQHLATDGITLVDPETGEYTTRPMTKPLMMAPANRADFLFQAPQLNQDEEYKIFTIWAMQPHTATDQKLPVRDLDENKNPTILVKPEIKIATIIVRGESVNTPVDLANLEFPPVPDYLKPVSDEDVSIQPGERASDQVGQRRARQVVYSGWGGVGFPAGETNRSNELQWKNKTPQNPSFEGKIGAVQPDSMMIDCRKFNDDPGVLRDIGHHMLKDTAEEWTIWNCSLTLFKGDPVGDPSEIDPDIDPRVEHLQGRPYPTPADKDSIGTKAVDHPFHIHINPFWVVGIYDWDDQPLGWNYQRLTDGDEFYPRWQDVVRLPRNGGRVVFRSRFWDYAGEYVNHCHILQHEDNGMMQGIAVVLEPDQADYIAYDPAREEFPMPTWHDCYTIDWGVVTSGDKDIWH